MNKGFIRVDRTPGSVVERIGSGAILPVVPDQSGVCHIDMYCFDYRGEKQEHANEKHT